MSPSILYLVTDDNDLAQKARLFWESAGITVQVYSPQQWAKGLDTAQFRDQLRLGIPSLVSGYNPIEEGATVLPFPVQNHSTSRHAQRVSTMNQLESQAIQNAIKELKGNLTEAAKALGIGRATLYRKVKQYNINPTVARKKQAA